MTDAGPPEEAVDPTLAGLAEQITAHLQRGGAGAVEAILERHPAQAGALRAMLPTLGRLAELARGAYTKHPGRRLDAGRPPDPPAARAGNPDDPPNREAGAHAAR
ncbi:hypothetical protein OJF2_67790 [Aquisphaera giovannonii]|uniref:Uncharacterized protein n=1 Tax=Aquisphaera giovannonii TaxID=406548 RepID=A0A5B9WDY8_9BACT|nr:hypothetical protein [Aquisphaera giovannonii]QEH38181.1 hypothetical protein OJF2_67790 [Aquisphaera giovannonii]